MDADRARRRRDGHETSTDKKAPAADMQYRLVLSYCLRLQAPISRREKKKKRKAT